MRVERSKGLAAAQPGWLIRVKAGNYSGNMSWDSSGTAGNEIVIEAFGDGNAILDVGTGNLEIRGHYLIFDGGPSRELFFDGTSGDANAYDSVIYGDRSNTNNHHNTFSRLVVRNSTAGITSNTGTNISASGDYWKIYNCDIYGAADEGIYFNDCRNCEATGNIIHNNCGTGVQVNPHPYVGDEITISGNAIYNNGACKADATQIRPGISILSNSDTLYDIYVYNNIIWGNKEAGIKVSTYSNINARIYNNTVFNNVDKGLWLKSGPTYDIKNNIVYSNGVTNWTGPSGSNNLISNPSFASTSINDSNYLKLSPNSTNAIDKGLPITSINITDDYFGSPRILNSGFDIGAQEYPSGTFDSLSPDVPAGLRIVQH